MSGSSGGEQVSITDMDWRTLVYTLEPDMDQWPTYEFSERTFVERDDTITGEE